jgi:hypothetical protein
LDSEIKNFKKRLYGKNYSYGRFKPILKKLDFLESLGLQKAVNDQQI